MQYNDDVRHFRGMLSKVVETLAWCCSILPVNIKLQIYHALFNSHVNHCILVWETTTQTGIKRLDLLQKRLLLLTSIISSIRGNAIKKISHLWISFATVLPFFVFWGYWSPLSDISVNLTLGRRHPPHRYKRTIRHFRANYALKSINRNLPSNLNKYIAHHWRL